METLTFNLSPEHVDLLCRKLGYTPIIKVIGKTTLGKEVSVEKPISKGDFLFNYYAGLIDSHARFQKLEEVKTAAISAMPSTELATPQPAKMPVLSPKEIDDADNKPLGK